MLRNQTIASLRVGLVISVVMCTTTASADATEKSAPPIFSEVIAASSDADWRDVAAEHTLYLELKSGRVIIELAPQFAPKHVQNIETLVRQHYFDGLKIVRVQENYVVQWGDPNAGDAGKARSFGKAQTKLSPEFSVSYAESLPFTRLLDSDGYAPQVGFSGGFAVGRDPASRKVWLTHCNGYVGVGRDMAADSGSGAELYVVNGHAPRHLDRNVTLVGRVLQGMELLSELPRGKGAMGFYEKPEQQVSISSIRLATELTTDQQTPLQVMRTDTQTWQSLVESRRNRRDDWYLHASNYVELCNVPIPVRVKPVHNATKKQ